MKNIYSFLFLLLSFFCFSQNGADITGLVRINGMQTLNTVKILTTDGNGNLGYRLLPNLTPVENTVLSLNAVVNVRLANRAIFRNLPTIQSNRLVTLDSNNSTGFRTLNALTNTQNATGSLGLSANQLINFAGNFPSVPSNHTFVVVVDANGNLGKRALTDLTEPIDTSRPCTVWTTTGFGAWGPWYGGNCPGGQFSNRDIFQQRTCYRIDGTPFTETRTITETRSDGCTDSSTTSCFWRVASYGPYICDPANVNNRRRLMNEELVCTRTNGTTYISTTRATNYEIQTGGNQAPVANFTWTANYRTINFDASSSNDPDGNIVSYRWEYGDVTTQTLTSPTATKTYDNTNPAAPVIKTVTLTVTDNCGRQSSITKTVQTGSILVTRNYNYTHVLSSLDNQDNVEGNTDLIGDVVAYSNNTNFEARWGYYGAITGTYIATSSITYSGPDAQYNESLYRNGDMENVFRFQNIYFPSSFFNVKINSIATRGIQANSGWLITPPVAEFRSGYPLYSTGKVEYLGYLDAGGGIGTWTRFDIITEISGTYDKLEF